MDILEVNSPGEKDKLAFKYATVSPHLNQVAQGR